MGISWSTLAATPGTSPYGAYNMIITYNNMFIADHTHDAQSHLCRYASSSSDQSVISWFRSYYLMVAAFEYEWLLNQRMIFQAF